MALQGTLETFSVPEVLRLLAGTRKTGLLALDGDRGSGKVWLHDGAIVGARSTQEPEGPAEPVLFDLLRYTEGSFVFETGAEYDGDPAEVDVETALAAAEGLLDEWREIESVVPSLRVWVSMVPVLPGPSVTVSAEQWAALAIIGRGTSGHRLGDELSLGELDASRRIRDLVVAGLAEVDDTPVEVLPDADEDLGEAGTWTTTDDLTVGLAGFVARAAEEERTGGPADVAVLQDEPAADEPLPDPDPATDADHDLPADDAIVVDDVEVLAPVDVEPTFGDEVDEGGDDVSEPESDQEPAAEIDDAPAGEAADDAEAAEDDDEFLSQLANLSPKAAAAIEATASAEETAGRRLPHGEGDEEINRNLLLKFLSSAKP